VAMYVRREAVLSSQIEGTQSTLDDVLAFEIDPGRPSLPRDIKEVVNYVGAMNYGLKRLDSLPLSLRLLREIHAQLMEGTRGGSKSPGEFRKSQNWIGGRTLADATFVPPPEHEMRAALGNLERFLHDSGDLDPLITCALAHAQFGTTCSVPEPLPEAAPRKLLRPVDGSPFRWRLGGLAGVFPDRSWRGCAGS
jgi:Fic family protein